MPSITRISPSKRGANWRRVYLDGAYAFTLNENVVARFLLREGMTLSAEQIDSIRKGEIRQECFDLALRHVQMRLHSRSELEKKLVRREYPPDIIDEVLSDLARLDYVNDNRFARTRAMAMAQHRHHGRRRAMVELLKCGVKREVAEAALDDVYSEGGAGGDPLAAARVLARKQAPRLKRLDPMVARRRLAGMLQRRGFDYDTIKPVIDEVLGDDTDPAAME